MTGNPAIEAPERLEPPTPDEASSVPDAEAIKGASAQPAPPAAIVDMTKEMRLHDAPEPVTQLSKKALISLSVVGALLMGGVFTFALRDHPEAVAKNPVEAGNVHRPDGLGNLPSDYRGPKLGPPLPGDFGRVMLDGTTGVPPLDTGQAGAALPPPDPRIERAAQEREAARGSQIFFAEGERRASPATESVPSLAPSVPQADNIATAAATPTSAPTAASRRQAFLDRASDPRTESAQRLVSPASPNILQAGSVIAAALITGLRSDLPGQVTAQVTQNVYDSLTGHILLIPQGSKLIGQYDAEISFGQSRALLVWNRLILPNGRSIILERQPATDAQGAAGLEDRVNYHWGRVAKAAILSTVLGIGAELGSGNNNDIARAIRDGAQGTVNQAGQQIVSRQLDVPPTITIRPGTPVRVMVTRDLVLEPAEK